MENILHQLWLDNTEAIFNQNRGCPQLKKLTNANQLDRDTLCQNFTDEQKELLEKYDDSCAYLQDLYYERIFASGFRMGMQLTLAGMQQE